MATFAVESPAQQKAREARELLFSRLRGVMGTEGGRAVMWWVLNELGYLFSQSDMGEATHASARNAGRRDVALELMAELKAAAPGHYREMLRERLEVEDRDAAKGTP